MADLIIKPTSGNLLIKDDQDATRMTVATSTGATTLTNQVFPAGHIIQMKALTIAPQSIAGGYSAGNATDFTGVSATDITLNRTANTYVLYSCISGGGYTSTAGRSMFLKAQRTSGTSYTGTAVELDASKVLDQGQTRYYAGGSALLTPYNTVALDDVNINGNYTYRYFYRGSNGSVDFHNTDRGLICVTIIEFKPTS